MIHPAAAVIALLLAALGAASMSAALPEPLLSTASPPPRIWIFCGTPGDEEHHQHYEELLTRLRKVFTRRYGVADGNIVVLYGPAGTGYDGECTREALFAELSKVVAHTRSAGAAPAWLVFIGHANPIAGGAFYNLPGPDASAHDIGAALRGSDPRTAVVEIATMACSAAFLQPLGGKGRIVITAASRDDAENETEYPDALVEALEAPATDADGDGFVSVTELFLASHERVRLAYEKGNFMIKEHSLLDGNGDGRGTQRPAAIDANPAAAAGLRVAPGNVRKFD